LEEIKRELRSNRVDNKGSDVGCVLFLVEKSLTNINCLIAWLLDCLILHLLVVSRPRWGMKNLRRIHPLVPLFSSYDRFIRFSAYWLSKVSNILFCWLISLRNSISWIGFHHFMSLIGKLKQTMLDGKRYDCVIHLNKFTWIG
jgi:hypothetical protein